MATQIKTAKAGEADVQDLKSEVEYRTNLQDICNKIYSAKKLDDILLVDEISALFDAEMMTIYVIDGKSRELVSRFKSGEEVARIRLPLSANSIAGYAAFKKRLVNIEDVYDDEELRRIDPELKFNKSVDRESGLRTRQVLAYPIIFQKYLLGAIQLMNPKDRRRFAGNDEKSIKELAKILGIALYNQKRIAKARNNKFTYLLENQLATQQELDKATTEARQGKAPVEQVLIDGLKISKEDVGKSLSHHYNVPFEPYSEQAVIPGELLTGLKVPYMRQNVWVPLRSEDGKVIIAVDNPSNLDRLDMIRRLFPGKQLSFNVALKKDILDFITLFTQDEKQIADIDDLLSQLEEEAEEVEEAEAAVGEEDNAVVQLVNKIILDSYARDASDIHIEPYPGKDGTSVRIRVDGNCVVYQSIPYNYRNAVVSRIKIMSDLDIAERRKPQDGKIKFKKYGGKDIELRVATVPTAGGMEDVVMRILHAGEPIPLENMGFTTANIENFIDCITQPYGIIFVCGPTGSGKTTTLHSALRYINKTETKIWTAEDPVEITQQGLRQVEVKPKIGFDFATAMRAFLRADPDVIMVGEMRDKETAQVGIEASLTGHLVFSTLHTNSAPESITRLLDMGMDPFNFADAVLCILAQRLVRTLCSSCKEPFHPTEDEYDELVREYDPSDFERNLNTPYTDDLTINKAVGCAACNNTGYKGRMGLHELLIGTDEVKKLIQNSERMEEIRIQAMKDGMTTLKQDGVEKIFTGSCDLLQVRKVCIK